MTYTQEDIEAMAEAIAKELFYGHGYASSQPMHDVAKAALSASPVHAELATMKAENERLRDILQEVQEDYIRIIKTIQASRGE